MNRILFHSTDLTPDTDRRLVLRDRRARHIIHVLRASPGDILRVGQLDGPIGTGRIAAITDNEVHLELTLNAVAPPPWIDLLLAVPRPKVLKRLWAQLAALGVGRGHGAGRDDVARIGDLGRQVGVNRAAEV